jgi:hypothetical protein
VTTEKSTSLSSSRSSSDPVDFIVIEIPAEGRRGAKPIAWSAAAPAPAPQQRSSVWPELSKQVLYTQLWTLHTQSINFHSPSPVVAVAVSNPNDRSLLSRFIFIFSRRPTTLLPAWRWWRFFSLPLDSRQNIDLRFACLPVVSPSLSFFFPGSYSSLSLTRSQPFFSVHVCWGSSFLFLFVLFFFRQPLFTFYALTCSCVSWAPFSAALIFRKRAKAPLAISEINRPMLLNNR